MRISASQLSSETACSRQWWLRYVQRLPSKPKGNLDLGTCLHSVCERFLSADDLGRDLETGEPVNLYPDGWDVVDGRKLPPLDAKMVQRLVQTAIDAGILERRPGRQVEQEIQREVIDGVSLKGYVDCLMPAEVWDHKTTKSLRYAQTPQSLARNQQMLVYAKEAIERDPETTRVTLRHNVFVTDPSDPVVKKVETIVSRQDVEKAWARTQEQASRMLGLATATEWQAIEGPTEPNACSAYGGCAFRSICGGTETPEEYRERVEREIENEKTDTPVLSLADAWDRLEQQQNHRRENNTVAVSIFDRRAGAKPAPTPAAAPAVNLNGATPPAPAPAPQAATAVAEGESDVPPWANPDCGACKGTGISRAGGACRICDSRNKAKGLVTSDSYYLEPDGAGRLFWEPKEGVEGVGGSALIPSEKPAQAPRVAKPAIAAEPHPMESVPEAELEALEALANSVPPAPAEAQPTLAEKSAAAVEAAMPRMGINRRLAQAPAVQAPPPAPVVEVTQPVVEVEEVEDEGEPEPIVVKPQTQKATSKGGRPKTGFTIYVGCAPLGVSTDPLEPIFSEMAQQMAEAEGKSSYYELDPFRRRDAWMKVARDGKLENVLNKRNLVVGSTDGAPDLKAFVDAIRAIAQPGRVVVGMR